MRHANFAPFVLVFVVVTFLIAACGAMDGGGAAVHGHPAGALVNERRGSGGPLCGACGRGAAADRDRVSGRRADGTAPLVPDVLPGRPGEAPEQPGA